MRVTFDKIPPGQFRIDEPDLKAGPWFEQPGNPEARLSHTYKMIDGEWEHFIDVELETAH